MPRVSPNRLRDRLRRMLQSRPNEIVPSLELARALFPAEVTENSSEVPAVVMLKLADTMRNLRIEEQHKGRNPTLFETVRGSGYKYVPE